MTRVHLLQETISDQIVGRGTENALCDIASDALSLVGVTLFNMRSKSDQVRPRADTRARQPATVAFPLCSFVELSSIAPLQVELSELAVDGKLLSERLSE